MKNAIKYTHEVLTWECGKVTSMDLFESIEEATAELEELGESECEHYTMEEHHCHSLCSC